MKATCERIRALYQSRSPSKMEIDGVDLTEIRSAQQKYDPPMKALMSPCGLRKKSSCFWIPEKEDALKLKILVKAHCGSVGHRGKGTTKNIVRSDFH